jgi:hypothetical protein
LSGAQRPGETEIGDCHDIRCCALGVTLGA